MIMEHRGTPAATEALRLIVPDVHIANYCDIRLVLVTPPPPNEDLTCKSHIIAAGYLLQGLRWLGFRV